MEWYEQAGICYECGHPKEEHLAARPGSPCGFYLGPFPERREEPTGDLCPCKVYREKDAHQKAHVAAREREERERVTQTSLQRRAWYTWYMQAGICYYCGHPEVAHKMAHKLESLGLCSFYLGPFPNDAACMYHCPCKTYRERPDGRPAHAVAQPAEQPAERPAIPVTATEVSPTLVAAPIHLICQCPACAQRNNAELGEDIAKQEEEADLAMLQKAAYMDIHTAGLAMARQILRLSQRLA